MSDTDSGDADENATRSAPDFPMARAARCPLDPPPDLLYLQNKGPLVRVRLRDGSTPWLVTRYAEQRAILADSRVSSEFTQPGYPNKASGEGSLSFIAMDDPEHARLRRMVTAPFAIRRIEAMRPFVQRITDELIDDMLAGPKPVDLCKAFANPIPSLVICELLGVPYGDHEFFQSNSQTIISQEVTPDQRTAASRELAEYLGGLLDNKRAHPEDDLLSGLSERIEAGELPREEAVSMAVLLLFAGHETTANMISLGTLALLEHPDQLAVVRDADDPAVIAGAVEELLRFLHITHEGRRRAVVEDIEIAGHVIRAGEGVIMVNEIGNRDPDVFPEPNRLDVSREANRHMAFGYGPHQCLGQPLARMELQVVYGTLYRRIPTLRLAVGQEELRFKHDKFIYGVHELPVTW